MRAHKILMAVSNNLETDQRINKIATSLHKAGYEVTVLGIKSRKSHPYSTPYHTKRVNAIFKRGPLFYLEMTIRFFIYLITHNADCVVANDADTLLPVWFACKIKREKFVADLHELFPEVPEVYNRPLIKKIWTFIETISLPHIDAGYTVCQSIAEYYQKKYSIHLGTIRNMPNYVAYGGMGNKFGEYGEKKIILYQGAVNVGRGIEWVMDATKYLDDCIFIVIGNGNLYDQLSAKAKTPPYCDKVKFLGQKQYIELNEYTRSADLGVCLLEKSGLSYYYSLPNRIFDFMQAHVPILATDFPEIHLVLQESGTGFLTQDHDPFSIAQKIKECLSTKIDDRVFDKACHNFNWQNEEKKLLAIYKNLF